MAVIAFGSDKDAPACAIRSRPAAAMEAASHSGFVLESSCPLITHTSTSQRRRGLADGGHMAPMDGGVSMVQHEKLRAQHEELKVEHEELKSEVAELRRLVQSLVGVRVE